jgi:hypothetical protein
MINLSVEVNQDQIGKYIYLSKNINRAIYG